MKEASSEARNAAALATSFGVPTRPSGWTERMRLNSPSESEDSLSSRSVRSDCTYPVTITFDRMPWGPKSIAMARLIARIPDLVTANGKRRGMD